MNPLTMYDGFTKRVYASTSKFTRLFSCLKPVFDEMDSQLKAAVANRDHNQLTKQPISNAIAKARRDPKGRATKYKDALDWLEARWGADNGAVGALRAMIELEHQLTKQANDDLIKRRSVDRAFMAKAAHLANNLISQEQHFKQAYNTTGGSDQLNDLLVSVAGNHQDLLAGLLAKINIPAKGTGDNNQNRADVFTAFVLQIVKIMAFESGRGLLQAIVDALGNRQIVLSYTWEGFAADFFNANSVMKTSGQLNVQDNVVTSRVGNTGRTMQHMLRVVEQMQGILQGAQKRRETSGRNMSLKIEGVWTTFHEIHVGVPTMGTSKTPVLFISPIWVTVYHELCHMVRLLQGAAWPQSVALPAHLKDSYDIAEELFNIQAGAPYFSEFRILSEAGLPRRLTHGGMIVPAPSNHGSKPWNGYEVNYEGAENRVFYIGTVNEKVSNELGPQTPFKAG